MSSISERYFDLIKNSFQKKLLTCSDVADCKANTTKDEFENVVEEFNLNGRIKYLVTDNCRTMVSAFEKSNPESCDIGELDTDNEETDEEDEKKSTAKEYINSQEYKWSGCTAHQISTILKNSFKQINQTKELVNVKQLHTSIKRLITHFNHTGKNLKLKTTLKQEIDIRFDSIHDSYKSVLMNLDDLKKIAEEDSDVKSYLDPVVKNLDLFEQIFELLKVFYQARKELSDDTKSNINLVLPFYFNILTALEPNENDDTRIELVKSILTSNLKKTYKIKDLHYKSTFLTPKYKGMRCVPFDKREAVIKLCANKIKLDLNNSANITQPAEPTERSKPSDSSKSTLSILSIYEDEESEEEDDDCFDDLDFYLNLKLKKETKEIDPCIFYSSIMSTHPILANYAISILTTPATSTIIEQQFSIAGIIMNKKRSCILPKNLNNNLFIKSNKDLFEK